MEAWHGATRYTIFAGQAVAASTKELYLRVHDSPFGDAVVDLHLFNRMPGRKDMSQAFARLIEQAGACPRGIFPYPRGVAGIQRYGVVSVSALLSHLFGSGIESTVKFMASGAV